MQLIFASLACVLVCTAQARNVPVARISDRTLYIRSIPEVKGYNSQIYEVLMTASNSKDESALGRAVAVLRSSENDATLGEVNITEVANGKMQMHLRVEGLTSKTNLGLSVRENGDCRKFGPVFKPDQPANSIPSPETPAGYLGSFSADESGKLEVELVLGPKLSMSGHRSVLARGFALHDMDKNALVACGILGRVGLSNQDRAAARRRRHHFGN